MPSHGRHGPQPVVGTEEVLEAIWCFMRLDLHVEVPAGPAALGLLTARIGLSLNLGKGAISSWATAGNRARRGAGGHLGFYAPRSACRTSSRSSPPTSWSVPLRLHGLEGGRFLVTALGVSGSLQRSTRARATSAGKDETNGKFSLLSLVPAACGTTYTGAMVHLWCRGTWYLKSS